MFVHHKGLANSSDLKPKSLNDQKLDMSPLCSKQSKLTVVLFMADHAYARMTVIF